MNLNEEVIAALLPDEPLDIDPLWVDDESGLVKTNESQIEEQRLAGADVEGEDGQDD